MTNLPADVSNAALYSAGAASVSDAGLVSLLACAARPTAQATTAAATQIDLMSAPFNPQSATAIRNPQSAIRNHKYRVPSPARIASPPTLTPAILPFLSASIDMCT